MTLADDTRRILLLEAVADRARAEAAGIRKRLSARATLQLAEEKVAPSWNLPGVATVTLGVSTERIEVADEAKLTAWVEQHSPDQIEHVARLRPAYLAQLLGQVVVDHGLIVWTETGEVVPGLTIRPGGQPKNLAIVPKKGVREGLAGLADELFGAATAQLLPAAAASEPPASADPFDLFPPAPVFDGQAEAGIREHPAETTVPDSPAGPDYPAGGIR